MVQQQLPFIVALLGITFSPGKVHIDNYPYYATKTYFIILITASVISCQVYPSEYAYKDNSITRAESASANLTVGGIQ